MLLYKKIYLLQFIDLSRQAVEAVNDYYNAAVVNIPQDTMASCVNEEEKWTD